MIECCVAVFCSNKLKPVQLNGILENICIQIISPFHKDGLCCVAPEVGQNHSLLRVLELKYAFISG